MNYNASIKKELSVEFNDRGMLYKSYMGFLNNGGIFILTDDYFDMNDRIYLNIRVKEGGENYKLLTEVVWKNTSKHIGVGLSFIRDELSIFIKNEIEEILGDDFLNSEISTYTM